AVAEIPPQLGDLVVRGRWDGQVGGEDRERVTEELRIGEPDRLDRRRGLDAGPLGDLPGEAREAVRPRVPPAGVAHLRELQPGRVPEGERATRGKSQP